MKSFFAYLSACTVFAAAERIRHPESGSQTIIEETWTRYTVEGQASAPKSDVQQLLAGDADIITPLSADVHRLAKDSLPQLQALYYSLGPRFVNAVASPKNSTGDGVGTEDLNCIFGCATNLIKLAPCIATFVATKNPVALLSCGIGKNDVCSCVNCLPDAIEDIAKNFCSSGSFDDFDVSSVADPLSYSNFIQFSFSSPFLQAYRGDLLNRTLDEVKKLGSCYFGKPVGGDCGCCFGMYITPDSGFNPPKESYSCVGQCVQVDPLPSIASGPYSGSMDL